MMFTAFSDGVLDLGGRTVPCALGRAGVVDAGDKREGDGCSPLGVFALKEVLYRADRGPPPTTALPARPIEPEDGWCDAPEDPNYNRKIRHPYPTSAERLFREDEVYDLLVVLGYNTDPVTPGRGSAIFLHLAREGYPGTEGCVALARADLLDLLAQAGPEAALEIRRR